MGKYKRIYKNVRAFLDREPVICRKEMKKAIDRGDMVEALRNQIQAECWEFFDSDIFRDEVV